MTTHLVRSHDRFTANWPARADMPAARKTTRRKAA